MKIFDLVSQFTKEIAAYAQAGLANVSAEDYQERLETCKTCPHMKESPIASTCGLCGCIIKMKAKMATSTCPDEPSRWKPQDAEQIKENRSEITKMKDKILQDKIQSIEAQNEKTKKETLEKINKRNRELSKKIKKK